MKISKKRKGFNLQVKTVEGKKGTYLFFKTPYGSYNTFLEVAAKDAAKDCGAIDTGGKNTRQLCKEICGF
jgi:hypothetical protein